MKNESTSRVHGYHLVFAGTLFDDDPSLLVASRVEKHDFDETLLEKGTSVIGQWPHDLTVFARGSRPVDYFIAGPYFVVVSENFVKAVDSVGGERDVEFLPVRVVLENGNEARERYWVVNVMRVLDALDWAHSVWSTTEVRRDDPDAFLYLIKPAFRATAIRNAVLFQVRIGSMVSPGIYISGLLKRTLESTNAALGLEFQPIKVIASR